MALTKVQTIGIETGISLTGVTTVTTLNASTDTLSVGGTVNFGGNVSIAGTLTYEDVTNIDSVGIITARSGINVTGGDVGIGLTNPEDYGNFADDLVIYDSSQPGMTFASGTSGYGSIYFADGTTGNAASRGQIQYGHSDDYMAFATAASEALRIDSSGRLLLGTTTEGDVNADNLTIADSGNCGITIRSGTSSFGGVFFSDGTSGAAEYQGQILYDHNNDYMRFQTSASERMRIDSSGRLLVGTSSSRSNAVTASKLQIEGTGPESGLSIIRNGSGNAAYLQIGSTGGDAVGSTTASPANNDLARIIFAGSDGSSMKPGAYITAVNDQGSAWSSSDCPTRLVFSTTGDGSASPTERMRIDSSGNFGLGTTSNYDDSPLEVRKTAGGDGVAIRVTNNTTTDGSQSGIIFTTTTSDFTSAAIAHKRNDNALIFYNGQSSGGGGFANATERMRITSDGKFGFGTSSPSSLLHGEVSSGAATLTLKSTATSGEASVSLTGKNSSGTARTGIFKYDNGDLFRIGTSSGIAVRFETNDTTRLYLGNDGFIGTQGATATGGVGSGQKFYQAPAGSIYNAVESDIVLYANRTGSDGTLIELRHQNSAEGSISVSGSTVSYNGGHLSRWSQLPSGAARTEILRGSVLSNLDEMCEWGDEDNEQLNRMKVSDVEGDPKVAGVFQAWDDDDDTYTNDFYCAMTGDFVIRVAQGTTVANGDLLMSAGDGTAKPQDDDIVRSKTIAKVTSTTVSTTYSDGSYCVPCVLMTC